MFVMSFMPSYLSNKYGQISLFKTETFYKLLKLILVIKDCTDIVVYRFNFIFIHYSV